MPNVLHCVEKVKRPEPDLLVMPSGVIISFLYFAGHPLCNSLLGGSSVCILPEYQHPERKGVLSTVDSGPYS